MKIKSFFGRSTAAAIEEARREMGPEAVIVESRRAPEESRQFGDYEVVVGVMAADNPRRGQPETAPPPVQTEARLSAEVAEMRRQLELMRNAISRNVLTAPQWSFSSPELAEAFATLVAEDMDAELARDVVDAVHSGAGSGAGLAAELEGRLRVNPAIARDAAGRRVAALVGPPGAGKTTTLVKLAISQGLTGRRPVQLLSMDNYRVAGADQLRSFAAILGVGFQALETVGALAQALEEYRGKGLILIDTPGYGRREMDAAGDLARFLSGRPDIDVHLVLTASMRSADLTRVARQFDQFKPANLLFTRLDETETVGSLFSLAIRSGKPLSFLGTGQQIPEDLEAADSRKLVRRVMTRMPSASLAA